MGRRFAGVRGKILLLVFALMVFWVYDSQLLLLFTGPAAQGGGLGQSADALRYFAPPTLLLVSLLGTRAHGFHFNATEVQLLFPAPIPRRQLLVYNIFSRMQVSLLSAAWVFIFVFPFAGTAYGAFIAIFLVLTFIQLTGQLLGLMLAMACARGWTARVAWSAFGGVLLIAAAAMAYASTEFSAGLAAVTSAALGSPVVMGISWVTRPFIEIFVAPGLPEVAAWVGIAVGILLAQVFAMMRLDSVYLEIQIVEFPEHSGRRRKRWWSRCDSADEGRGIRIPMSTLPRLGGAGPLAWRQCQELLRNPATLLRGGFGILAVMPIVAIRSARYEFEGAGLAINLLFSALFAIPMLVDGVDFRRDIDRMAVLRAFPLSPLAISIGQLIPTALLLAFWMALGTALIAITTTGLPVPLLIIVCWVIPPYAMLTAAIDNFLFLLMPYRPRTRDPGETTFLGRLLIMMLIKIFALLISMGICAAVTAWILIRLSPTAGLAGAIAFVTLSICCLPVIKAVAWAFHRFDVSQKICE